IDRIYFKTFKIFVQAPVKPSAVMTGEVLAAMFRGLFASLLIVAVGFIASPDFFPGPIFILTLLLNSFLFANLGVIVGMRAKSHEDTATYSNFLIMPMAFFSGTFFPIDQIPVLFQPVIRILPLTHANILIRKATMDTEAWISLGVIAFYAMAFFIYGSRLIKEYSE
ncbi:MAG: ABC transporter permease, partial [Smithella sp.]